MVFCVCHLAKGGSVNNNVLHQVTEVVDSITSSILPTTALSAESKTVSSSQGDSSTSETAQGAETAGTKKVSVQLDFDFNFDNKGSPLA